MIAAAIFDLDGTLTRTPNPWRHIHESLGVWERACGHFDEWLTGRIDYDEFCRKDTSLWGASRLQDIHGFLDRIELNRHVPAVTRALVGLKIPSIIISSGFHYVARRVQTENRWEPLIVYANELVEGPALVPDVRIQVSPDPESPLSKRAIGADALRRVGVDPKKTLVVSDAVRDLEALSDCGFHLHVQEEGDLLRTLHFLD
jgi:HAD superfamily phosphoserine phosphatase-like hydrolase